MVRHKKRMRALACASGRGQTQSQRIRPGEGFAGGGGGLLLEQELGLWAGTTGGLAARGPKVYPMTSNH